MSNLHQPSTPNQFVLLKIGGNLASDLATLDALAAGVLQLKKRGYLPVVVHGGNNEITRENEARGINARFVNGLRITDETSLKIIEMVLSGLVNKRIVTRLNLAGCLSAGISGKDGGMLRAEKFSDERAALGWVGDVVEINSALLHSLSESGIVPVVSPVSCNSKGETLNVNADSAAAAIALELKVNHALFLTEAGGVYDAQKKILPQLSLSQADDLITRKIIDGGMLPKISSVALVAKNGAANVRICGCNEEDIANAVNSQAGSGTRIQL